MVICERCMYGNLLQFTPATLSPLCQEFPSTHSSNSCSVPAQHPMLLPLTDRWTDVFLAADAFKSKCNHMFRIIILICLKSNCSDISNHSEV